VANLRCGAWYSAPAAFAAAVRFKSTDGHRGEWTLNERRLNLHLVTLVAQRGGNSITEFVYLFCISALSISISVTS
jgi:tRNA A64-2'-O-ribosylphosphate transferase